MSDSLVEYVIPEAGTRCEGRGVYSNSNLMAGLSYLVTLAAPRIWEAYQRDLALVLVAATTQLTRHTRCLFSQVECMPPAKLNT